MFYAVQVSVQRDRVWVHASDGSTVARFDRRFGMDIHNTAAAQLAGAPECLHCTHEPPGAQGWAAFREEVRRHFGVDVPADAVDPLPARRGCAEAPTCG